VIADRELPGCEPLGSRDGEAGKAEEFLDDLLNKGVTGIFPADLVEGEPFHVIQLDPLRPKKREVEVPHFLGHLGRKPGKILPSFLLGKGSRALGDGKTVASEHVSKVTAITFLFPLAADGKVAKNPTLSQGHPVPSFHWNLRPHGFQFELGGNGDLIQLLVNGVLELELAEHINPWAFRI
jgi:hypothetical protein